MDQPDPAAVVAASKAVPGLDPQSVIGAAIVGQSQQGAAAAASAAAQYAGTTNQAQALSQLTQGQQRAVWNSSSQSEQAQLLATGYTPVPQPASTQTKPAPGTGAISDVTGFFGKVGDVVSHAAGDVLNATEAPLRAIQHVERAGHVLSEMGDLQAGEPIQGVENKAAGFGQSFDPHDLGLMFSPSAWSTSWRETTNGEKTFDPAIANQIARSTSPQNFHVAKQLASVPQGADTSVVENQIVNSYPAGQRQQITQLLQSPQIKTLVTQLQASKISAGRDLVGEHMLVAHPAVAQKLAGGIDAALDYAQDPTMQLGKAAKLADAAKWGIDAERAGLYGAGNMTDWESAVRNVSDQGAAQRFLERASSLINNGDWRGAQNLDPHILNYAQDVIDHANGADVTADSLKDYFASRAGMSAILSGKAAREAQGAMIFPHLSALGAAKVAAKGVLTKTIDFMADANVDQEGMGKQLAKVGLHTSDLAGTLPEKMAQDGSLPGTAQEVATLDGSPINVAKRGGYASTAVLGGMSRVGRSMRQMTTLTADQPFLDLADPTSAQNFRKMLQYSLPATAVDHLTDLYLRTPDVDQRFRVVKGAVDQMLHLAGVYSGPDGAQDGAALMDAMDQSFHGETYAPGGIDKFADGSRAAVLDSQVNHRVYLPSFKDVHAAAMQNAFLHSIRVPMANAGERFMAAWRAGVLWRLAFPIRTSIDENLSNVLRNGLVNTLKAHVVTRAAAKESTEALNEARVAQGLDPILSRTAKALAIVTDHVPDAVKEQVQNVHDLAGATFGEAAWRATSPLKGDLGRSELMDAARLSDTHLWDGFGANVSAVEHSGGGYDEGDEIRKMMSRGKPTFVQFRTGRTWSEMLPSDDLVNQRWTMSLGTIAESKLARAVLNNIDEDNPTQVRKVLDVLNDPDFADTKKLMRRGRELPDNRIVGHGATQQEADRAFAQSVVDMVNQSVRTSTGEPLRDLVDTMKDGVRPELDQVEKIHPKNRPDHMFGPDMVPMTATKNLLEKGFHPLSEMMDSLSRKPIYTHAVARALRDTRPWAEKLHPAFEGVDEEARQAAIEKDATEMAGEQAMRAIKPYLHSPEIRSQFEVLHRTAFPFLFAQVQFAKRWAKTFALNPDALAKAQLGMNGLRTSGVIHTDQNGNEYFYYPGSQYVTDTIARAANAIGIPASIPLQIPFTGQVKYIMPGLNDPLTPSVGPTVAIPLKALTARFPELQNTEQAVLGAGASNSYWEQVLPTSLSRVIHAVADNPELPGQLSSATMQAMQQLQASGHGLSPVATSAQKQVYVDRVVSWARILLISKAIMGFAAPASPTQLFDPKNLSGRLSTLLGELPYDQAITEFMKENPDASAYTVFASQSAGGAELPATKAAGTFLDSNQQFAETYPQAVGWLIPRTTGNQPYDSAVYREQIEEGLRDQKTPGLINGQSQFLNDILVAPASKTYYAQYDAEQTALQAAKGDATREASIRATFDQWKASFMAGNPTFADQITSSTSKANREQTIWQLQEALTDPNLPRSAQTTHVSEMLATFDQYQRTDLALQGQTSAQASATRTAVRDEFESWGAAYAQAHADVSDLWSVLLEPEVTDTTSGLASTPSATTLEAQVSANQQALASASVSNSPAPPPAVIGAA